MIGEEDKVQVTKTDSNDVKVVTFGCRLNAYESELIKHATKDVKDKNIVVFNSCAVTNKAESDLRNSIRKIKKQNPHAKVVVTGCAAQADAAKYAKMSEVDLVLGNQEKSDPASYDFSGGGRLLTGKNEGDLNHQDKLFFKSKEEINNSLSDFEFSKIKVNDIMSVKDTAPQLVSYFEDQTRAFLEIQNGCNHRCTFCIIPFGRGNSRSVSFGDIVAKVKELVANGHKEVVLTGVDITSYGEDIDMQISLSQMIKRLLKLVPELPRLRLSSVDVAELLDDDDFFDLLRHEPRFMPYLHLSVQSGDDLILKRMKRRHTRQQVLDFCQKCREIRADMTFGCDIIAGFPTETQEAFENSLNLIQEAGLIFCHIFPYSPKEGTPAAKLKQINGTIIKERARLLREAGEEQLQKYRLSQIGIDVKALVEKNAYAKTENFLDIKLDQTHPVGDIINLKFHI